jgi:large subunit ribosomal protein L1
MNTIDTIKEVKSKAHAKFDETLELHATVKKQGLTINVTLPYSSGKTKKIEVADDATIKKLETGKVDFDVLLATADMMPKLVKFAKVLGPKGLMPNPKTGTIIKSAADAKNFSGNQKTIKTEKEVPLIHTTFGKVSQKDEELEKNLDTLLEAIGKKQIVKAVIKATMSPGVKLSVN